MKTRLTSILIALIVVITSISINGKVFAYNEFYSSNDILFYDENVTDCGGAAINLDLGVPGGPYALWQSGAQPEEYSLERFAIEVLRYIAIKKGVGESDTVTKEHVVALVAFMMGEGGDTANPWLFNPLNNGLDNAELVEGERQNNGTQSFKSFDAGITATAIAMLGSYQSRLAGILIKKDSTADDFMKVLTYYLDYPGNKAWATASIGDNADAYYQNKLATVEGVRRAYDHTAGIKMGTPEFEKDKGIYVNFATLKYSSESDPTVAGSTSNCGGGSLVSGGMTLAEAQQFMLTYKNLSYTKGNNPITEYRINAANCGGWPLANCVAFSQYFINRYTTKAGPAPNGRLFVEQLLVLGFTPGYNTPKVYAVFTRSTGSSCPDGLPCGHTGVVLGIDETNDKIILGEASCGQGMDSIKASEYKLSIYTNNPDYTYAYTDAFLKSDGGL